MKRSFKEARIEIVAIVFDLWIEFFREKRTAYINSQIKKVWNDKWDSGSEPQKLNSGISFSLEEEFFVLNHQLFFKLRLKNSFQPLNRFICLSYSNSSFIYLSACHWVEDVLLFIERKLNILRQFKWVSLMSENSFDEAEHPVKGTSKV